jgi:hypothetical protein
VRVAERTEVLPVTEATPVCRGDPVVPASRSGSTAQRTVGEGVRASAGDVRLLALLPISLWGITA